MFMFINEILLGNDCFWLQVQVKPKIWKIWKICIFGWNDLPLTTILRLGNLELSMLMCLLDSTLHADCSETIIVFGYSLRSKLLLKYLYILRFQNIWVWACLMKVNQEKSFGQIKSIRYCFHFQNMLCKKTVLKFSDLIWILSWI